MAQEWLAVLPHLLSSIQKSKSVSKHNGVLGGRAPSLVSHPLIGCAL